MKFFIVLALASVVLSANSRPAYNQPSYGYQQSYDEPANYQYSYNVYDDYSGAKFNANEYRNGYSTDGSYSVDLPDGRTQTVTYNVADGYSGFVADVQYSGYANNNYHTPARTYAARPTYQAPRPAYHAPRYSYHS